MNKIIAIVIMSMLFFITSASACNDEFNEGYNDGLINGHHDGFSGLLPQYNEGNYNNPYVYNPEYRRYYDGYTVGYPLGYSTGVALAAAEAQQIIDDAKNASYDAGYIVGHELGLENGTLPDPCPVPEGNEYPTDFYEGFVEGYNAGIEAFNGGLIEDAMQACYDAGYVYGYGFGIVNDSFPTQEEFEFPEDCDYPLDFQKGTWNGYTDGINTFNEIPEVVEVEEVDNGPDRTLSSPYFGPNCQAEWRGYVVGDIIPTLYTYWTTVEGTDFEVAFTMPTHGMYVGGVHVTPERVMGRTLVPTNELDESALALRIAEWRANHA